MLRTLSLAVACLLLVSASADAAMIVTINRASDTQVTIGFSGSFSANTPSQRAGRMFLPLTWTGTAGACTISANTVANSAGYYITSATLDNASNWTNVALPGVTGYANELYLNWNANTAAGQTVSGSITLNAPAGATWAPVGTTGAVFYGRDSNAKPLTNTGTYTVTPEPATMSLLALGGLALVRRRRA